MTTGRDRFAVRALRAAGVLCALALVALPGAGQARAATAPNGLIVYQCIAAGGLQTDICTVDPATGTVVNLTNDPVDDASPDWSPTGAQIVFDSFRSTGQPNIHVMSANGGSIQRISATTGNADFQGVWSPDGQRIAFVSTRDGDGEYELYVMNALGEILGTPAVRLTDDPAPDLGTGINDWQPTWSPDSRRLAFVTNRDPVDLDVCDLWVMDAIDANGDGFGDNLTRLTFDSDSECDINSPAWSPTGGRIAFTSTRSFDYEVWVINADGTNPVNVTNFPGQDFGGGWSPDGTQITFVSGRDGDYEIYSVPAPPPSAPALSSFAAAPRQLTHNTTADVDPDWGARTAPTAVTVWAFMARTVPTGVVISWRSGSESAPIGFNVWRSTTQGTRYRKLNRSLLSTARVGAAGSYRFADGAPADARRSFYRLEAVSSTGTLSGRGRYEPARRPRAMCVSAEDPQDQPGATPMPTPTCAARLG